MSIHLACAILGMVSCVGVRAGAKLFKGKLRCSVKMNETQTSESVVCMMKEVDERRPISQRHPLDFSSERLVDG